MYEVWLMLNIVYEIALSYAVLISLCVGGWLVLMWLARRHLTAKVIPLTLKLGAFATVLAFIALPAINKSSFSAMGYWVDWFNLASWALTAGVMAACVAFPATSLLRKPG
jgi:hypothetical protein